MNILNSFNESRAKIVSLVLENTWEKIVSFGLPDDKKIEFMQKKINTLKETQEIAQAYVLNKEGVIVFSTEKHLENKKGDFTDDYIVDKMNKGESLVREAIIDKDRNVFSFYVPLGEKGQGVFAVRLFFSLANLSSAYSQIYQTGIIVGLMIIFINFILGVFLSHLVIGPIKVFSGAAKVIASGRLDLRVNVATGDELEILAKTFNSMTEELIRMKEKAENANPLTKLPGNIVIREEIEKRINEGKKFAVIYCDLDNFKAYNDKYGIAKGDEAITLTGEILKEAVKNKGSNDDLVGHEGGDDFLLVTELQETKNVTDYIISEFNKRIRNLFDKDDLERGHIVSHARDGSIKQFPIMTISMAGVTNEYRRIASYAEVTNRAAEMKKKAKNLERSCFVLDQRKEEQG
ncbi:MAG: diguanylate cyclase [Candidatus Omnitrophica bacterium]|nr:diguanylate cyclase [Candidatus Omnitrophota bacterium]